MSEMEMLYKKVIKQLVYKYKRNSIINKHYIIKNIINDDGIAY